ncbi:MAG: hypothetical protein KC592_17090, partial [Nitrospira sp.]|nr:hypothetical protein [Nitrospira sp.]
MSDKKSKPNYGHTGAFQIEKVSFSRNDMEALDNICEEASFLESMQELAGFFKGYKLNELNSSKISEQRAALLELETLTDKLTHSLLHLDADTSDLIVESSKYKILPSFFIDLVQGPLTQLATGVELARRELEKRTGAPYSEAERLTLEQLVKIFESYSLAIEGGSY